MQDRSCHRSQQTTRIVLQNLDLDVVTLRATLRRRRPEIRAHCTARLRAAGLRHRRRRRRRRHCSHRICPQIRLSSAGAPRPDSEAPPQHEPRQKTAQVDATVCLTCMRHPITPYPAIRRRRGGRARIPSPVSGAARAAPTWWRAAAGRVGCTRRQRRWRRAGCGLTGWRRERRRSRRRRHGRPRGPVESDINCGRRAPAARVALGPAEPLRRSTRGLHCSLARAAADGGDPGLVGPAAVAHDGGEGAAEARAALQRVVVLLV